MKNQIVALMLLFCSGPALAGESSCHPGHGVNCVDLCRVDPGNRLNNTDYAEVKISETITGSCSTWDGPERVRGQQYVAKYRVREYNLCSERYYENTVERSGCRAR